MHCAAGALGGALGRQPSASAAGWAQMQQVSSACVGGGLMARVRGGGSMAVVSGDVQRCGVHIPQLSCCWLRHPPPQRTVCHGVAGVCRGLCVGLLHACTHARSSCSCPLQGSFRGWQTLLLTRVVAMHVPWRALWHNVMSCVAYRQPRSAEPGFPQQVPPTPIGNLALAGLSCFRASSKRGTANKACCTEPVSADTHCGLAPCRRRATVTVSHKALRVRPMQSSPVEVHLPPAPALHAIPELEARLVAVTARLGTTTQ